MHRRDSYFRRKLSSRSDPEVVYAAYQQARESGDTSDLIHALLPLATNIAHRYASNFSGSDISDELIAEIGLFLVGHVKKVAEAEFNDGNHIIKQAQIIITDMCAYRIMDLLPERIDITINPITTTQPSPEWKYQCGDQREFLKRYARDHLRLTGELRRLALRAISNGEKSLRGVANKERRRFVVDYLKVQARIGDRVYDDGA